MTFLSKQLNPHKGIRLSSLLLVIVLLGTWSGTVQAAGPTPQQLPHQPEQSTTNDPTGNVNSPAVALVLPPLKAVVTVGDVDGPSGQQTLSAIANMKPAVDELIARGVSVQTFYPPKDDWNAIKAAANGAQFFFYGGHGISDGSNNYGGMWFTGNGYVSPTEIKTNLKLARNAIVMLFGCFTAGSGTEANITSAEALHRVSQYSEAFFAIGAAGYYSNWSTYGFQTFTRNLFNGLTLGNAYKNYADYNANTVEIYTHPSFANLTLWLDKDYYAGGNKYDNAFGGLPNVTLQDLFATTNMVTSPNPIVGLTTKSSAPQVTVVTVSSTSRVGFTWTASLIGTGSWAKLSSTSGTSGSQSNLTLNPTGLSKGTYTGTLSIHTDTPGVTTPVQDIPVKLVVAGEIYKTYLPNTIR